MKNRRNYYRILHVQPDAPLAVIKSSYSALMLKLKLHPDLGGDHETAALINEAYSALSNVDQRAEYDRSLASRQSKAGVGKGPLNRSEESRAPRPPRPAPRSSATPSAHCLFCASPHHGDLGTGVRCGQCRSPLTPPISLSREGIDQRIVQRFARDGEITVVQQKTLKTSRGTIQDLSPTGMCLTAVEPLAVDQVVRIDGSMLTAVARVVSCRQGHSERTPVSLIGVEFLTLDLADTRGTFVSSRI